MLYHQIDAADELVLKGLLGESTGYSIRAARRLAESRLEGLDGRKRGAGFWSGVLFVLVELDHAADDRSYFALRQARKLEEEARAIRKLVALPLPQRELSLEEPD